MVDCVFLGYLTFILVSREESLWQRRYKDDIASKQASKNESTNPERIGHLQRLKE